MSKTKKDEPLFSMDDLAEMDEQKTSNPESEGKKEENEEEEKPIDKPRKKSYDRSIDDDEASPTVQTFREDGKFTGRIPVELQGLSSQMLPPLTKRKFAVYEGIGNDRIDPLTKQVIDPQPIILPGRYVIYDPFQKDVLKRHITLKNVTRFETVTRDGRSFPEEVIEDLVMDKGVMTVPIEKNYLIYALMELHPLNESNRWRDKTQAPTFRRTDINKRGWGSSVNGIEIAYEAETQVVQMRDSDAIIRLAHAAGIPTAGRMIEGPDGGIKRDLRVFARNSPKEFFSLDPNNNMAIKIAVLDAKELGLIEYRPDNRTWIFAGDGAFIGNHLPGEDPEVALIKLLGKKEYKASFEKLHEWLNYWD